MVNVKGLKTRAESLNKGAATATAFSQPILKATHLIANFKKNDSGEPETLAKHPPAR